MEINKVYNENCLDIMKRMPDNFIDLTLTSPPYDNLRDYKGYEFDFENIAKQLYRVTKEGGVIVWIVGDATINGSESGTSFKQALYFKDIGFYLHDTMIYEKNSFRYPEFNRYNSVFEYMFILSKNKPKTINLIKDKKNKYYGDKVSRRNISRQKDGSLKENSAYKNNKNKIIKEIGTRTNIWKYNTGKYHTSYDKVAFYHPAIFPEQLANDHIISWSNENDLVYDPFMGSGTTAKMAIANKRNWIGSEISSEYCKIIEQRINGVQVKLF